MFRVISFCFFFTLVLSQDVQENFIKEAKIGIGTANMKLTGTFLYNAIQKNPCASFITSMFPGFIALGITAKFSKGKTRRKAFQAIELQNEEQIDVIYRYIKDNYYSDSLVSSPKYTLKIYTDNDNKFCPAFEYAVDKYFYADTGVVDYSYPQEAARKINNYVKQQGTGGFKDLVDSRKIEDKNGLNFISTFEIKFKFDRRFVFTKDVSIPFKTNKGIQNIKGALGVGVLKFAYIEAIDANTLEILGRASEFAYYIVLPRKQNGLMKVLDKFRDPEFFQQTLDKGKEVCAKIKVPSREIVATVDLGKAFKDLPYYYNEFFVPGAPELSGVSQNCDNTYIASILQEIRLIPDATNRSSENVPCSNYDMEVEVNQPYLFYMLSAKSYKRSPLLSMIVQG